MTHHPRGVNSTGCPGELELVSRDCGLGVATFWRKAGRQAGLPQPISAAGNHPREGDDTLRQSRQDRAKPPDNPGEGLGDPLIGGQNDVGNNHTVQRRLAAAMPKAPATATA